MSVVLTSSLWLRLGALTTVCGSLLAGILVWQTKLILAEFGAYLSTTEILMLGANSIDVALLMIVGGVVAMLASIWLPRGQKIVDQCAVDMLSTDRSLEQCEARARRPSHHASEWLMPSEATGDGYPFSRDRWAAMGMHLHAWR